MLIDIRVESINQSPLPLCLSVHTRPHMSAPRRAPPSGGVGPALAGKPATAGRRPRLTRASAAAAPPRLWALRSGVGRGNQRHHDSRFTTTSPGACAAVGPRPATEAALIAAAPTAATGLQPTARADPASGQAMLQHCLCNSRVVSALPLFAAAPLLGPPGWPPTPRGRQVEEGSQIQRKAMG